MHKYSHCCCCLSRWASRATSRSLSRAALMAAVADAVRRGAQRAAKFFTKMCSFGLIQIFRPRSRPNSDIPCSFGIYIIRSTCKGLTTCRQIDAVTGLLSGNSLEETGISRNHSAHARSRIGHSSSRAYCSRFGYTTCSFQMRTRTTC